MCILPCSAQVVYPERVPREPFVGLAKQLKALDVRVNIGVILLYYYYYIIIIFI